ncbi:hypothetical protein [Nonomuraea sp. B19D2]|uniref:hypothetical protein n=1 Tax=Nonomuraea sp. B19D2 TaxID=3159561 RepID=UPI0032DBBF92
MRRVSTESKVRPVVVVRRLVVTTVALGLVSWGLQMFADDLGIAPTTLETHRWVASRMLWHPFSAGAG